MQSIHRLGIAVFVKVFLRFEKRFWKEDVRGWGMCGIDSMFNLAFFYPYYLPDGVLPLDEGLICVILIGRSAKMLQEKTDSEVAVAAANALPKLRSALALSVYFLVGATNLFRLLPCMCTVGMKTRTHKERGLHSLLEVPRPIARFLLSLSVRINSSALLVNTRPRTSWVPFMALG